MEFQMTDLAVTDALFFERTGMEPARIEALVGQSLAGMDDGELYLEYSQSESLALDDGRIKSASFDTTQGFGLRAVVGEAAGYAHASELSEAAIRRAADTVRAVASGHSGIFAAPPPGTNRSLYTEQNPLGLVDLGAKTRLLAEMDAYARSRDPRVRQVMASLSGVWQAVQIIRPDGRRVADIRPLVRLSVAIVVGEGERMETGSSGAGGPCRLRSLSRSAAMEGASRRSLASGARQPRLGARAGGRDDRRPRAGLAGGHAARGGRPRARRRFQPQEDVGVLRNDRAARREQGRDGRRRRDNARPARLADRRR